MMTHVDRRRAELRLFRKYAKIFGGLHALAGSPYLHLAVAISVALAGVWTTRGWWDVPLSVLPNILGFSIGGFAMFLSFGDEAFRKAAAGRKEAGVPSPLMQFSTAFMHFIFVQIAAILAALIARSEMLSWLNIQNESVQLVAAFVKFAGWFFGFLLFSYAITSTIAATFALYRMVMLFDVSRTPTELREPDDFP